MFNFEMDCGGTCFSLVLRVGENLMQKLVSFFIVFLGDKKKNSFQKYFHPLIIHSLDLLSYGSESRMLLCLGRKINDLPEGRVCLGRMGVGGNYGSSSLSLSGFHASYVLDRDALHKEESNCFHQIGKVFSLSFCNSASI